ncbi:MULTISPECIES: ribulose-phosphate 3-epimerase [unclassified Anaerobiospirillum]|uniref:ribulose-phosphate 3-epimerase n=1 Tax=unclassified Anaerobiospirillum TaxID=2647410 RepID=UPI001FF6253A|nr:MULTISPECIES: ribulose-phosphate 3-epimerase [unclassified Anaerobiospirillum]MCK0526879.1 ribulose-phosphate 3-epimerase [Anaerobiospirillum sp. NML120449]MCK0534273.1 ribulose-phosphate 3-epimerase [Anaerobiospirillum sp. NML120511]MCK0539542.1 ribulose-phosphate 3-epimerase [Anaerobiospirillum sp. NML02-A-032]
MEKKHLIAGSILAADLLDLGNDIQKALDAGVDIIHFDVMDYHFVQNLTFGPDLLKAIRGRFPEAVLDVHLMVDPINDKILTDYARAGASMISFHPEATPHVDRYLSFIREQGCQAGLVFNPGTDISCLDYLWERLDFVLIMTVNPGFGGQKLIPSMMKKIADVKAMAQRAGRDIRIEVDGGVAPDTIRACADAGAELFVVGSALFNKDDYAQVVKNLHQAMA